jgi:hypothetical protein
LLVSHSLPPAALKPPCLATSAAYFRAHVFKYTVLQALLEKHTCMPLLHTRGEGAARITVADTDTTHSAVQNTCQALRLHCGHVVVTLLLHCCYIVVTLLSHGWYQGEAARTTRADAALRMQGSMLTVPARLPPHQLQRRQLYTCARRVQANSDKSQKSIKAM